MSSISAGILALIRPVLLSRRCAQRDSSWLPSGERNAVQCSVDVGVAVAIMGEHGLGRGRGSGCGRG